MKKTCTRILTFALVVILLFSLLSCGAKAPAFSRGTIDGDVYTSEFAGLTFTKPADWIYLTDEQIAEVMGVASEVMGNDTLEETSEGSVIDLYAASQTSGDNVNITFSKGNAFTNLNVSIAASLELIKQQYESVGFTCTISDPTDAKLGSVSCKVATATVNVNGISMTQYCYFAMFGRYVTSIICTSVSGATQADFEAMFS